MSDVPLGVQFFSSRSSPGRHPSRDCLFKFSVLGLTYLAYTSYHLSRKPISIVKNAKAFVNCEAGNGTCTSWVKEINDKTEEDAKTYLGLLDTTYLVSYAVFMFVSGFVAERVNLRYFLSFGMVMSGVFTYMFGLAYVGEIHSIWYLVIVQILCGLFQTTGWPGVVTVMANWFGKGRRGLIMGIWNSHTSLGNILGSLIAGVYVEYNWGLSFIVPGLIIAAAGVLLHLFLVTEPAAVGLAPPRSAKQSGGSSASSPAVSPMQPSRGGSLPPPAVRSCASLTPVNSSSRQLSSTV